MCAQRARDIGPGSGRTADSAYVTKIVHTGALRIDSTAVVVPKMAEETTKGSATRRWPSLSMSRPMNGPAAARVATPTAEIAPASPKLPRRSLSMTMIATPNIDPPTRENAVPAMNRRAPGTRNRGT